MLGEEGKWHKWVGGNKMITYPDDHYDDGECKYTVDFVGKYENPEYCIWLEKVLLEFINKSNPIDGSDAESKIRELDVDTTYIDDFCIKVEDKKIRYCNPLLKDYPLNVVDPDPCNEEVIKIVNEWEIHFVAIFAKKTLDKTNGYVKPMDYAKMLKKMEPYKNYFLERTWNRLLRKVPEYLSVRIDKNIEWFNSVEADNIIYDINFLTWGNTDKDRFLSIDADLNNKYWQNIKIQG